MRRDIRLWTIDGKQNKAEELVADKAAEEEKVLEDLFAYNPDLLMPGLQLIARQASAGVGSLDLLGIDNDGRMIIFELKKEKLARDSVAQIIDYSSYLESLDEDEIARYVVDNSGKNGITKINDFQTWYDERYGSTDVELRPIRMMLIAFDADATAQRMVEFLNNRGVAISIRMYSRYTRGRETLMVGHHDRAVESRKSKPRTKESVEERMHALNEYARELSVDTYWGDVVNSLYFSQSINPRKNRPPWKSGVTFYQRNLKLSGENNSFNASHSALLEENGTVRIIFYPIAIHLCKRTFESAAVDFKTEPPPNVPKAADVDHQWYCILKEEEWNKHKSELSKLSEKVYQAWENRRKSII